MATLVDAVTVTPFVDYSLFTLEAEGCLFDPAVERAEWSLGLAQGDGAGALLLVTARQFGALPVTVELWDGPAPVPDFGDVVEVALAAPHPLRVSGWAGGSTDLIPFLIAGDYRVRYAIADGDLGREHSDPPYPERYLLQLWPQRYAEPVVLRRATPFGRYWHASWQMRQTQPWLRTTTDVDVIVESIDAALAADPDSAARIRNGEHAFTIAISPLVAWIPIERQAEFDIHALIIERAQG